MTKEKKQLIVVGSLVLVVFGVGAFQFLGHKPKVVVTAKKETAKKDDPAAAAANGVDPMKQYIESLISGSDSARDPFIPQAVVIEEEPNQHPDQTHIPSAGNVGNDPRVEIEGPYKPLDPHVGDINSSGIGLDPSRDPNAGPVLRGVMIGKQNIAVFEGADGRQFLAQEGQRFGKDWTVVAITESEVVLNHGGKVITLGLVGGN